MVPINSKGIPIIKTKQNEWKMIKKKWKKRVLHLMGFEPTSDAWMIGSKYLFQFRIFTICKRAVDSKNICRTPIDGQPYDLVWTSVYWAIDFFLIFC